MRIIPAIDIIEGKCVRLTQGDYNKKTIYSDSPLEMAKQFEGEGLVNLHLVDLDGAKSSRIVNYNILEEIALKTGLKIDFGGGLKSLEDVNIAFECGASQITLASLAISSPDLFMKIFKKHGEGKIILGADFQDSKVKTNGWLESSEKELESFIYYYNYLGVNYVIPTDISKDGMLSGPSFDIYHNLINRFKEVKLIASGGVSGIGDLEKLRDLGCDGVILGKAIYEKKIDFEDLRTFI
jgi:phosphoribosylformimino-5-aminoimidazole carboxamide ribotide isomerase